MLQNLHDTEKQKFYNTIFALHKSHGLKIWKSIPISVFWGQLTLKK